ncbi:MAG TPA: hypothetical protein VMU32_01175 [Solirubrobacteraceae bacterium]|nr:hypothetical protein [Solirubrobacteraceae bacterium]
MRSRQLETALTRFVEEAAARLQADLDAGAEVPFELDSRSARGHRAALYCYRPLTRDFIADRWSDLRRLPSHAAAVDLLGAFDGLDRYLLGRGGTGVAAPGASRAAAGRGSGARADGALRMLLQDVFAEHSDFRLAQDDERLRATLERLDSSAHASPTEVTLLATLHGLAIGSPELPLAPGLTLVRPDDVDGIPDGALDPAQLDGRQAHQGHLLVACRHQDPDAGEVIARARDRLAQLLRALRLFGDGRISFGPLAWTRVGDGPWNTVALGGGGRPHGMLLVGADHEDELRAFCNLIARRAPQEGELAWALRRYEIGCERLTEHDALSDHLLALRALLEPDGDGYGYQGLLAPRLAALCAAPAERRAMIRAVENAIALERAVVAGTAIANDHGDEQVRELAGHLRALLRDVICGHLDRDLVGLADEILAAPGEADREPATAESPVLVDAG